MCVGMNDFLAKPVRLHQLISCLETNLHLNPIEAGPDIGAPLETRSNQHRSLCVDNALGVCIAQQHFVVRLA